MKISNIIIKNNSDITEHVLKLIKFMEAKGINMSPYPKLSYLKEDLYEKDMLGPTAWYDADNKKISVLTKGRHPKDVLRSISHELIHHNQNIEGKIETSESLEDPKYAQNNKKLRILEAEAYLKGNMLLRDYLDNLKHG